MAHSLMFGAPKVGMDIAVATPGGYKPDPEVYQGAATALGLEPHQVMMVAAHKSDLRAAQAAGLRTAFVERPLEKGMDGGADRLPDPDSDVEADGFIELAARLAC